jgi:hypothetical protein
MRHSTAGRALATAQVAGIGLAGLFAVRLVSLHTLDNLLFSKPLHLNWLLDIGATATVFVSALVYCRAARRRAPGLDRG